MRNQGTWPFGPSREGVIWPLLDRGILEGGKAQDYFAGCFCPETAEKLESSFKSEATVRLLMGIQHFPLGAC